MRLYTIGYVAWEYRALIETLQEIGKNGKVLDVRYNPVSRFKPEYARKNLQEAIGKCYNHAHGLGNMDYKSDNIRLADPEPWYREIVQMLEAGQSVVLLCACGRLDICHRLVIAREIERRMGVKAEHLYPQRKRKEKKQPKETTGSLFGE